MRRERSYCRLLQMEMETDNFMVVAEGFVQLAVDDIFMSPTAS